MADLIVDYGFKDLGYEYVLIDDCCEYEHIYLMPSHFQLGILITNLETRTLPFNQSEA
jgi:hypothetical protein